MVTELFFLTGKIRALHTFHHYLQLLEVHRGSYH